MLTLNLSSDAAGVGNDKRWFPKALGGSMRNDVITTGGTAASEYALHICTTQRLNYMFIGDGVGTRGQE